MQDARENLQLRDGEGAMLPSYVHEVQAALEAEDPNWIRALTAELHEADLADLIEQLKRDQRAQLIESMGPDFSPETLSELDEPVRDQVLDALPNEQLADAVRELESDQAVYLLEDLNEPDKRDILAKLPEGERAALQLSLDYPEDSAGRLMQTDFIAVPPFWSVGQTIDYMREDDDLPSSFSKIFVVDPTYRPVGTVALDRLLRTKRPVSIEDIADGDMHAIPATEDQEEVAREFDRYDLISAPVVNEAGRMVGVVTIDDVVDVIQEEAEEDIHRLGGVGDESITDSVIRITRGRITWLLVNLCAAFLAATVIAQFDATIQQMVALAILMPIVASMGGNAGTQTMTVTVRALATRELGAVNATRVITREVLVGLLNGLIFASILGVVAFLWFGSNQLGLVIGAAMIINMLVAALAGIMIPLVLNTLGIDPAVASSTFVTMMTDVIGFFAFLGLATIWLI